MKKNNEGYVLAMVMAVIAVLAVVASAMLGVGLRNVQTQQAAVVRMQAKYEAEGAIEAVLADYLGKLESIEDKDLDMVKSTIEAAYNGIKNNSDTNLDIQLKMADNPWRVESETQRYLMFELNAETEAVKVSSNIEVYVELEKLGDLEKYKVKDLALIYKSYEMEVPDDQT